MKAAQADGQDAVAVTEHGNMSSALQFYKEGKKAGVKPIIGCEAYVTNGSYKDRNPNNRRSYHLILLAMNRTGYANLVKLTSLSHLEGFYYKPRIDHDLIKQYHEGLICLSACLSGEVPAAVRDNKMPEAIQIAGWHKEVFGDRYYLEIQHNGLDQQEIVNKSLMEISKKLDIPLVATNDCHYLAPEDARAHDALLCIGTGKFISDENRKKYGSDRFYFRSAKEMSELFHDTPEAIENTVAIARRCNLELEYGDYLFPVYEVGKNHTIESQFREMSQKGLEKRLQTILADFPESKAAKRREIYTERLEKELSLIEQRGFAAYFLIVQDFMNWARDHEIPVGPGRGSAAGSLVSYCLGITNIDPIRYGLIFERFMNPERGDNPDIDCDFCAHGREKVIDYVTQKYGQEKVCQIATFGTLKAKAAVRDVGRVLGFPYADVDKLAKLIPDVLKITLDKALETSPELKNFVDQHAWAKEIFDYARPLEGLNRQAGKHAAGLVIAPNDITDYVPLQRDKDGFVITQWDKGDVESYGLIKFDFLGLKTLTIIDKALDMIEQNHNERIDIDAIPMDDQETFRLLSNAHTAGVFQLESRGMKDLLKRIGPTSIDEIVALVALYRPGPMSMLDDYIARKKGEQPITYEQPVLEDILKETYGMMVYQEQVMEVGTAVGGLSLGASDKLRRLMSKKTPMDEYQALFMKGAQERGIPEASAKKIWEQMDKFAEYGFNKSHSAAYAVVAYQTAYLKAHYPLEFISSLLTMECAESDKSEKLKIKIDQIKEMEYEILPPDINASAKDFCVEEKKIRFGLAGVRNVGGNAIDAIIEARNRENKFIGLNHFLQSVSHQQINKRTVESLIMSGSFDSVNPNRAALLAGMEKAFDKAVRIIREKESRQHSIFEHLGEEHSGPPTDDDIENVDAWSDAQKWENEKISLGFYLTGHPLQQYAKIIRKYTNHTCDTLKQIKRPVDAQVGVFVTGRRFIESARGRMAILTVEDLTGTFEAVVYSDILPKMGDLVNAEKPLLLSGRAEAGEQGFRFLVKNAVELENAGREIGRDMLIRIHSEQVSDGAIEMLKNLLANSARGRCRPKILVEVPGAGEAMMTLPPEFCVRPEDQLVTSIEKLLGSGVINFS